MSTPDAKVNAMPYLEKNQIKTVEILPSKNFVNQVNNYFINRAVKNKLAPEQFEILNENFLESVDAKLLLFCINYINLMTNPRIVTEET
ncbi:MAG TPA: hypothetical protein VKR53_00275 [Puia sp.]|nr:hypothetical protein [Puia sp.]